VGWWPTSRRDYTTVGRWNGRKWHGPFNLKINVSGSGSINWFPRQTTISASGSRVQAQQIGSTFSIASRGAAWTSNHNHRHAGIHVSDL